MIRVSAQIRHLYLVSAIVAGMFALIMGTPPCGAGPFSDVPPGHWAYSELDSLATAGVVKGYPEGAFKAAGQGAGTRPMTRFEFASVLARALTGISWEKASTGQVSHLEKLIVEFGDELSLMGMKVNDLVAEVETVRGQVKEFKEARPDGRVEVKAGEESLRLSLDGDLDFMMRATRRRMDSIPDDWENEVTLGMNFFMNIDPTVFAFLRLQNESVPWDDIGTQENGYLDQLYIDARNLYGLMDLRFGRQYMSLGHSLVLNDKVDGIRLSKRIGRLGFSFFAFATGNADTRINEQDYGNASGTKNFWIFDDTYGLTGALDGNGAARTQSSTTGSAANYAGFVMTPGTDQVTLYSSPYSEPMPFDGVSGDRNALVRNDISNGHPGIAVTYGSTRLLPLDSLALPGHLGAAPAFSAVGTAGVTDSDGRDVQDLFTPQGIARGGVTRDWQMNTENGLDSMGVTLSCEFGSHSVGTYFLHRRYDRFDPYTRLGDPWAAMADMNGDMAIDTDLAGNDRSPSARPWYLGLTLDGNLVGSLDYFFEYVHFDPDLVNVGVNPLTGTAMDGAKWRASDMASGQAWVGGLKLDFTRRLNLIFQYGQGTEEFVPASIYWRNSLNGMRGRLNSASPSTGLGRDYDEGTFSLNGVTDLLLKVKAKITERTTAMASYEGVADNDTSQSRLIAGDPAVTGHPRQDYSLTDLRFEHRYSENATVGFGYTWFRYQDSALDNSRFEGTRSFSGDDMNWGGWSRVETNVKVRF